MDGFVRTLSENMVIGWLSHALPSKFHNQIKNAERSLDEGRITKAQEILRELVREEMF